LEFCSYDFIKLGIIFVTNYNMYRNIKNILVEEDGRIFEKRLLLLFYIDNANLVTVSCFIKK
jgi:hypothetical protein